MTMQRVLDGLKKEGRDPERVAEDLALVNKVGLNLEP